MGRIQRRTARSLLLTLSLLPIPLAATAQTGAARERLNTSAGWGVDRATGAIAVDSSLLVLYDPVGKTLVVNPNFWGDALTETGAIVQRDGTWRMPDGNVVRPLIGSEAIVLGDEPAGLIDAAGLPTVPYDRVTVTDSAGLVTADPSQARGSGNGVGLPRSLQPASFALKVRHSHTCSGCAQVCNNGCHANEFISQASGFIGGCDFKLFHRCRQEFAPACQVDVHECDQCLGGIRETYFVYLWQCTGGC